MGRAERYNQCWSRCPVTLSDSIEIFTMLNEIVSFAQLFVGKEGSGTLPIAIAYAQYLLSHFSDAELIDVRTANKKEDYD